MTDPFDANPGGQVTHSDEAMRERSVPRPSRDYPFPLSMDERNANLEELSPTPRIEPQSQPWSIQEFRSRKGRVAVIVETSLASDQLRELAKQLTTAADALDNDGYKTTIVRLKPGYGVMPVQLESPEVFSFPTGMPSPVMK